MRIVVLHILKILVVAVGIGLILAPVAAIADVPTMREADVLFAAQAWEKAAKAYASIVESDPENGRAWFRLGTAYEKRQLQPGAGGSPVRRRRPRPRAARGRRRGRLR
jgi:hypothetical protein